MAVVVVAVAVTLSLQIRKYAVENGPTRVESSRIELSRNEFGKIRASSIYDLVKITRRVTCSTMP